MAANVFQGQIDGFLFRAFGTRESTRKYGEPLESVENPVKKYTSLKFYFRYYGNSVPHGGKDVALKSVNVTTDLQMIGQG